MSEKNMAVLQFLGYRVVNILYDCAPEFEFPDDEISYHFNFSKTNTLISSNDFQENLEVNVFYSQDGDFANAPYKLTVEIAGRFVCNEEWKAKWEANALAIMFPYLRSIVSMITSSSGREPIILPTMNVAKLFEKIDNNDE
jgi:preprotein translocase subunit SecB